jgi:hypothetical protein
VFNFRASLSGIGNVWKSFMVLGGLGSRFLTRTLHAGRWMRQWGDSGTKRLVDHIDQLTWTVSLLPNRFR